MCMNKKVKSKGKMKYKNILKYEIQGHVKNNRLLKLKKMEQTARRIKF